VSTSVASAQGQVRTSWSPPPSSQSCPVTLQPVSGESVWLATAESAIAELRKLGPNWDGYGSPPLTEAAVKTGFTVLRKLDGLGIPVPLAVPVTGGGFALEFQVARKRLEIEILPEGDIEYLTANKIPGLVEGDLDEGTIPAHRVFEVARLGNWLVEL